MEKLIDRYCEVWGEPDGARRAAMLAEVWAEGGAHHDLARFEWHVVQPDGQVLRRGIDIAELSGDGKIRRMMGFFL
jgi:hypothetical protein